MAGPRGFDGAKKVNGIKRHIVVDTLGLLVAVLVTAGNVQDRSAAADVLSRARRRSPVCATSGPTAATGGKVLAGALTILRMTIEIASGVKPTGEFVVQPRRCVLERTFSWIHRCRRLTRQCEQSALADEAMTTISVIALMLRRLDGLPHPPS